MGKHGKSDLVQGQELGLLPSTSQETSVFGLRERSSSPLVGINSTLLRRGSTLEQTRPRLAAGGTRHLDSRLPLRAVQGRYFVSGPRVHPTLLHDKD